MPLCCSSACDTSQWRYRHRTDDHTQSDARAFIGTAAPCQGPASTLVCFLASHIASAARAEQFEWLLRSIASQLPTPPTMCISWSAASLALEARIYSSMTAMKWPGLHFIKQQQRLSQFEHMRELVRFVQAGFGEPPLWIYFSDDDDIWSERRHVLYTDQCCKADNDTSIIVCTRKARPTRCALLVLRRTLAIPETLRGAGALTITVHNS